MHISQMLVAAPQTEYRKMLWNLLIYERSVDIYYQKRVHISNTWDIFAAPNTKWKKNTIISDCLGAISKRARILGHNQYVNAFGIVQKEDVNKIYGDLFAHNHFPYPTIICYCFI